MTRTKTGRLVLASLLAWLLPTVSFAERVGLFYDAGNPRIEFAAQDLQKALGARGYEVETHDLRSLASDGRGAKIVLALQTDRESLDRLRREKGALPMELGEESYAVITTGKRSLSHWVVGGDDIGVMYGGLQLAECISGSGFSGEYDCRESPFMRYRGIKLNLPLDRRIPTYVGGWSSNSAKKAIPHVWDISFWKELIDRQARNRYNVLSVWVHHPFPALVRLADYPKACLPRIEGFDGLVREMGHEQRVAFWREVMRYAHDRGMKFYFFNWNVYLDYAKSQYPELTTDLKNPKTLDYMNQCVKALMDTYPDLDGFGISAGDGMSESAEANTTWTYEAIGRAVKEYLEAHPERRFRLIHRSIYSNPELFDRVYAPLKEVPNVDLTYSYKYAQAHMYSTTAPKWGNQIEAAARVGLETWLTIRNDDYFYINWGDSRFVREYMARIPMKEVVDGMYIGSDGYNPTRTYFCREEAMNGRLEVDRRWYMEMLWGRISYNPGMEDAELQRLLQIRYPAAPSDRLFEAWTLASGSLPKVTELIMGNWSLDFHWYPEACWSDPKRCGGFRTIEGFGEETTVAKGSDLCDIAHSAKNDLNGRKSSYEVADEIQRDSERALSLINGIDGGNDPELTMALENIRQMSYLGIYYAYKIRGATYRMADSLDEARDAMASAYCWWIRYTQAMERTYHTDSFRNLSINPDWHFGDEAALKEYTDLGGTGIPSL